MAKTKRPPLRLFFESVRWPAARAGEPKPVIRGAAVGLAKRPHAVDITTTGRGRQTVQHRPGAWWRNFVRIDPADGPAVARFVARHGDPFGRLSPTTPTDSGDWPEPIAMFGEADAGWEAPNAKGISLFTKDPERIQRARRFISDPAGPALSQFQIAQTGVSGEMTIRPLSIMAFMVISAVDQIARQAPMSTCIQCGDFFEFQRANKRFCSPACEMANGRAAAAGEDQAMTGDYLDPRS